MGPPLRWSSLRGDAPAASASIVTTAPSPLTHVFSHAVRGQGMLHIVQTVSLSGPSQGRQGEIPAVCLSHPLILLSLWQWVEEFLCVGAPPQGCSLLPSILASELGAAPAGTRVAVCPHQSSLSQCFCLGDTAAPWWSCLDISALHASLLCQLLPKLPHHVLLTAPTSLSILLAMLLVTSTPQGLLLHVWGLATLASGPAGPDS